MHPQGHASKGDRTREFVVIADRPVHNVAEFLAVCYWLFRVIVRKAESRCRTIMVETFVPPRQSLIKTSPKHTPGGSYEISCSRTAASAKSNRGTACLAVALMAGQAMGGDIVGAPIDLSAFVHEAVLPGGTIFEDTHSVTGALTTPTQSADYLYLASKGENLSGRSTNIQGAFASSLASSDGNGGVGVTAFIGGSPSNTNPAAIGQLVSQATWKQSFTYNGTIPASISVQLHIPALEVGLIGVPPNRESFSATETAEAKSTLSATIIHPDLSTSSSASFEFGLRRSKDNF